MAWSISNAMMKAYENLHCSQEQAAESLVDTCSDGEQSAPSSTTPTPDQYYWPDKTTEHSRLSRFGMTCEPLTANHGEDLLTWFRAGFPARTSAPQEKGPDLRESAVDYGVNLQGSFARYDQEASLWRTAQCSLVEDSDAFLETWPRWGMTQSGASYLLPTPVHLSSESESGLWPTPVASDVTSRNQKYAQGGTPLSYAVKLWPTPTGGGKSATSCLGDWGGSGSRKKMETLVEDGEMYGPLNPEWVEWLMGWPIGQTDLKPLATVRFQEWQQQHGSF